MNRTDPTEPDAYEDDLNERLEEIEGREIPSRDFLSEEEIERARHLARNYLRVIDSGGSPFPLLTSDDATSLSRYLGDPVTFSDGERHCTLDASGEAPPDEELDCELGYEGYYEGSDEEDEETADG